MMTSSAVNILKRELAKAEQDLTKAKASQRSDVRRANELVENAATLVGIYDKQVQEISAALGVLDDPRSRQAFRSRYMCGNAPTGGPFVQRAAGGMSPEEVAQAVARLMPYPRWW